MSTKTSILITMKSATDAATGGVLYRQEKMFSEILQNSQENTYARVSFLIKLKADPCNFIRKETLAQVFSSEFCEITKNTFFTEHVWATLTNSRNFSSFFFSSSSNSRNFSMSSNFSKQIQSGLKAALWLAFTVSFISVSSFKTLYWNSTYLKKKLSWSVQTWAQCLEKTVKVYTQHHTWHTKLFGFFKIF